MGQNVGYIFVGSSAKFFWGSVLVLSGMYLLWFALYRREKVLMVDITLRQIMWLCGDYVESFGWPDGPELTGSNRGPDIDRTRKDKGAWISSYALSGFGGPYVTWTHDQSIMSEGLTQYHCTINIETLPRITPKSTSKITSPDYPHDFTDVADGNSAEPISPPPPSRKCREMPSVVAYLTPLMSYR